MRIKLPVGYFGKLRISERYDDRKAIKFIKMRRFRLISVLALILVPAATFALSNNSASLQPASNDSTENPTNSKAEKPMEVDAEMNQSTDTTTHTNVSINSHATANSQSVVSNTYSSSSVSSTANGSNSTLTINGKTTQLPANGTISKDIPGSNGGNTHIDVSVNGNGSSTSGNSSTSSLNFQITNQSTGGDANGTTD